MSSDLLFDPLSINFARILQLLFLFSQRYLHNTLDTKSAGFHIYTSNPHPVHVELICFFLLEIPQILPLTALVGFLHTDQYGLDMLSLPVYSPVSIGTILAELLRFPFCFPCKILFFDTSVQNTIWYLHLQLEYPRDRLCAKLFLSFIQPPPFGSSAVPRPQFLNYQ